MAASLTLASTDFSNPALPAFEAGAAEARRRNRTALRRFHGLKYLKASVHHNRPTRLDPSAIHQQGVRGFPQSFSTAVSNLDLLRELY
jgi:hypothetical protein